MAALPQANRRAGTLMSTIAITGATGFIGGHLVERLHRRGHRVLAFGRQPDPHLPPGVSYARWDIARDPPPPIDAGVDAVIHCAASVSDWAPYHEQYRANVRGIAQVMQVFAGAGQFILISTASVYDPARPRSMLQETDRYGARYPNAYGRTKMLAERVVVESGRPNCAIVRPHIVYGPRDTTLLPRLLAARRAGWLPVIGDGESRISLTGIENLADAIELILPRRFGCEIFNIADARTDTLNAVLTALFDALGLPVRLLHIDRRAALASATALECAYRALRRPVAPPLTRYLISQLADDYTLDIAKANAQLGYAPRSDYRDGFAAVGAWYRATR